MAVTSMYGCEVKIPFEEGIFDRDGVIIGVVARRLADNAKRYYPLYSLRAPGGAVEIMSLAEQSLTKTSREEYDAREVE